MSVCPDCIMQQCDNCGKTFHISQLYDYNDKVKWLVLCTRCLENFKDKTEWRERNG
jgi:hydrogenase maturation factor HypF (carbamoyltransferase family)